MSLLSHTPSATADEAAALALGHFGVRGTAVPLPGERDQNFRIDVDGVPTYVLKIANGLESAELLDAQHRASELARLSSVPTQQVEATNDTKDCATWDGYIVRLLQWLPGRPMAEVDAPSPALLGHLGVTLGELARALDGFDHPAAHRDFHWDVARADVIIAELRDAVTDPARRALIDSVQERLVTHVRPILADLPRAVIHGDANDLNVLVDDQGDRVVGLLDFGDLVWSVVVAELAVAAAYVVHHTDDPLTSVGQLAAGFHSRRPLVDDELAVLWDLVLARLALTGCHAAVQHAARPDDPYLTISEGPAWTALAALSTINPRLALYRLRHACGLDPHPNGARVREFLSTAEPAPLLDRPWARVRLFPVDLTLTSSTVPLAEASAPPDRFDQLIRSVVSGDREAVGIGGYGEDRAIYTGPEYESPDDPGAERRSVHLATDVWTPAGLPVCAPLPGRVVIVRDNDVRLDYGPVVVLEHDAGEGVSFYSLYGHLALSTLDQVRVGQEVAAGDVIGWVGTPPTNGDWAPHVHVQLILDLLDLAHDYPGVGLPSQRSLWLGLSPDPALLLHLP